MSRWVPALVAVLTVLSCAPADARDPFADDGAQDPPAAPSADPAPFVVPDGLYYVTDTYVADVVQMSGATTTYSTLTVHESTGTYARVVDTVGTGAGSVFDGSAFNGRAALGDGRAVAGTYYENFVLTLGGYVPVSIVFFQDDSETRRAGSVQSPTPAATSAPLASPSVIRTVTTTPGATPAPTTAGTPAPSPRPLVPEPPDVHPYPAVTAGVALAADGPTLASAEVLRGRLVEFWPRAFANGIAVPVRSWRLVSARPDYASATSGGPGPLVAQWLRMPAPETRWLLRFEVTTEGAPTQRVEAEIRVAVRSPALID